MLRKWLLLAPAIAAVFALATTAPHPPSIRLARVPHGGIQPQLAFEGGALHLLYFAGDPKAGDLFYATSHDSGATWSAPLRVNSSPRTAIALGTIRGGQMALGANGSVHVVWNGSSEAQQQGPLNPESGRREAPLFYSRLERGQSAFQPERNLMTRTFGLDGGGTVAADSAGNVYAAWHGKAPGAPAGEAGRQVWIAVSRDGGRTFAPEQPAWSQPTGACGCCGMSLFASRDGVLRALYRSATENVHRDIYLLTSSDRARSFTGRKLDTWNLNACPMSSMSFAEGSGTVAAAWETAGQVYYADLARAAAAPVAAPGEGKGRKHPRLAVAPGGDVLMLWTAGTGWQRGGSLAWQLFDSAGQPVGPTHMQPGLPAWSFGAVASTPGGLVIVY